MVMRRNAMRANLRQSILKSLGRYIAIAMIIALGAGIFVGLRMTKADMVATGQKYMDEQNMFDLRLATDYGWGREQLEKIVQTALCEAQIESLIIAKGYVDCVAYMSGEGISVAVSSPEGGLQQEDVAVIADIVMAQSDYNLDAIRVVEVQ